MRLSILMPMMLLAACQAAPVPTAAPPQAEQAVLVSEKGDLLEFDYGWPAEAAAIPALDARFEAEMAAARAEAMEQARAGREARGGGDSFFPHFYRRIWEKAGASDRLLSLHAQTAFFTGGAHPNSVFNAMLWDKEASRPVTIAQLFGDPESALTRLADRYCPMLDAQRAGKRGVSLPLSGDDYDTACPPLGDQVVVPADSGGNGRFDMLRVLIPPYGAGPYSEGVYKIALKVDAATLGAITPHYRASFEAYPQ